MRKPINVLLLCVVLLLFALPVSAAAPIRSEATGQYVFEVADCGDFIIYDDVTEHYTEMLFSDKAGTPIRIAVHVRGDDKLFTPAKPGLIVRATFSYNAQFDLSTGEQVLTGAIWHVIVHGSNNLYFLTGRNISINGEPVSHTGLNTDPEALCQYFRQS